MKLARSLIAVAAFAVALTAGSAFAQPNAVPGRDLKLNSLNGLLTMGRTGTFPNGMNGCAESTTSCNPGTNNIPWNQAMGATHPFISFIFARQMNGRLEQISDRSYVKHGFFATNSNGCGVCQNPGTSALLGLNCSDTYATSNNGDNFWLAPAEEINPWTGAWVPACSHFDKGEPPVALAQQCDGIRSLSTAQANALGPVGHRVRVPDSSFNVTGAQFFYQGMYTTQGEPESNRGNNMGWKPFNATWTGSSWSLQQFGSITYNSVLSAWTGATVTSNTNGTDDGRVYVAVKITGPTNGLYHYEYAVHNRDNSRGVNAFRLPVCSAALVANAGFKDTDTDASNDWTFTRNPTEIVFNTANNPLNWNEFFNFWFDSDAGPVSAAITLDEAAAGAGAAQFSVPTSAPSELYNVNLGGGCGTAGAPDLHATGSPAKATLGNATFGIETTNVAPGASTLLWASALDGSLALNGSCTLGMNVAGLFLQLPMTANGSGVAALPLAIPVDPTLEGVHVNFATWEIVLDGAVAHQANLSNTLRVRIGNSILGCP